ncbi:c-type cytochrome [Salinisphaera sp. SWV1]|uniref:c-type cytochrome n=1 Tax=Salinisphaera sp. SWV1 TaxID=3454139 RepID=UPI003F84CB35
MKVKAYKAGDKPDGRRGLSGRVKRATLVSAVLLLISGVAVAGPSAGTGKAISGQCAACHGSNGVAVNSQYPNLAGQNYQYLVQQLQRFKSGQRNNAIMHGIASGLSKTQIQDLAAYYSSMKKAACRGMMH